MARDPEVKVKFSVFNEEYRKGINEINNANSTMKKEMKLTETQMKHTATESGKLEHNIKRLAKEKENVQKKIALTEKQLAKAKEYYGENSEEARKLENTLLDLQISEQRIENAIKDSNDALKEQSGLMGATEVSAKSFREKLADTGQSMYDFGDKMQKVGKGMKDFGKSWSMRVTTPIVAGGTAVFKAAMDYESAFAGVRKTVDATEEEFEKLSDGIRQMAKELPQGANEIAGVAEVAGQLGIKQEDILKFTRTMVDLGVATNMSSEEAATALARLANITQMPMDQIDRLGATVVDLGNNLATTEREIVEMGLRIAGAGSTIGMTEAQIMAFSGALSSVGINAEAGGTAISKLMINIANEVATGGKKLEGFAKTAGMSTKDFKKAFEEDAALAIVAFVEGLGEVDKAGGNVFGTLEDLGLTEVRLRDAMLRMSGAGDVLRDSLELGNTAWEENVALTNEAEQRYQTTESQLKIMWNRVKDVAISFGQALAPAVIDALNALEPMIKKVEEGVKKFSDMDESQQRTILKFIGMAAAIGPLGIAFGGLFSIVGGGLKTFGSLLKVLGTVKGGGLLGTIAKFTLSGGPVGIAITAILGLTGVITALSIANRDTIKDINDSIEARANELDSLDEVIDRYEKLQDKNRLSTDEVLRYMDIMTELKSAKSEETIKKLTDEQAELLKKSGLTNAEMEEFLSLNNTIVEQTPSTTHAISEQGNAYAEVTDEIRRLNDAERERLLGDTQTELITQMDEQRKSLEKQAKLQDEIKQLEQDRSDTVNGINENSKLLTETNREIESLYKTLEKSSGEEANNISRQIKEKQELVNKLETERIILEDNLDIIANQLQKKRDSLATTEKDLKEYERLTDQYLAILATQTGINIEKGNEYESIKKALAELDKQEKNLKKQLDTGKITTEEFNRQSEKIGKTREQIRFAQGELENMNTIARQKINKDIYVTDHGRVAAINKGLAQTITKTVNIRAGRAIGSIGMGSLVAGFAKGTQHHPGGISMLGEEGPELVKQGKEWFLANFGLFDLQRGAKVFTAKQTDKMLRSGKSVKGYADGVGNTVANMRPIINGMDNSRQISNLIETLKNNPTIITVISQLDGKVVAENQYKFLKEKDALNSLTDYF